MIPVTSLIGSATSMMRTESESGKKSSGRTGSAKTWEKADRMLLEARLRIVEANDEGVYATCRGDTGLYFLGYREGVWFCGCPSRVDCSHLRALQRVWAVEL